MQMKDKRDDNIMENEFELTEAFYGADGGCLRLISSKGTSVKFLNLVGDGEYKLYVLKVPGWGPAHFKDEENFKRYKSFLGGWEEIPVFLEADIKTNNLWKVMYYDGDANYDDSGIELNGCLITVFRKTKTIGDSVCGDMLVVSYR